MRKKYLAHTALALLMALLPVYGAWCLANAADDKRAELSSVQAQMQEMQVRKEAARRRAEAANSELQNIMGDLNDLQGRTNELRKKRDGLQQIIDENQAQLTKKKQEQEQRLAIYRQRLRAIYINGQINYLDVLLGAKDFSDFSSRMYLLQKIISSDIDLLEQLKKDEEEIKTRQAQLDASMKEIKAAEAELENKTARVNKLRDQRANILYAAQEEEQQSQYEYDRLLAISENIAAMLRNMEANGGGATESSGGTGRFMWPCRGEITSYYGWRTHPIFGTTKYHSGMDIAVDYGTPIYAADSGTVVYSGWLGGYGYCVMIDHGGGLVTLYGHNQALNVNEGQYVSKGTVIAYAGSTGYSTGPHCHFEVRLHGEVTEPLDYLPE